VRHPPAKAKQSKAKQSKAKQSKAKQNQNTQLHFEVIQLSAAKWVYSPISATALSLHLCGPAVAVAVVPPPLVAEKHPTQKSPKRKSTSATPGKSKAWKTHV
jgi:hypothetical protein